jgi:FlaA1/EpsC-like NDP-sugar epimerase
MSNKKFDTLLSGLIPALVLPVLTLLVIWLVISDGGLQEFLVRFQQMKMLSKLVSLAAIPNLLLFFIFIWTKRNFSARGVIFATFLLAFIMVILKFV